MNGWVGKILEVNLSDGEINIQSTDPFIEKYLGGRGIGTRLVYDRVKPGMDALAPGNPLIFSMGPLTGTAMPSSGRTDVTALSPLSNLRAKSNFGGYWGPAIISEHNDRVVDSLGICTWPYSLFIFHNIEKATRFFNQVTGKDWSMEQLLQIGERIRNLERMFDVRQGLNRSMDVLPKKFFEKPLAKGKYKGAVLDRDKFEQMKDEYYEQRGWSKETGIPTREKLIELGLEDVAADLPAGT